MQFLIQEENPMDYSSNGCIIGRLNNGTGDKSFWRKINLCDC